MSMYRIIDDRLGNATELFTAEEIEAFCRENGIPLVWNGDHTAAYHEDPKKLEYTLLADLVKEYTK